MKVNADFDERVVVHTAELDWLESPLPGVYRRMLDRVGDEVARATTIVRYAPGSAFSAHSHTGGEEFIVLDGVLQDEHGDFPAGSYVRNPLGTAHAPGSEQGCTIFAEELIEAANRVCEGKSGKTPELMAPKHRSPRAAAR